MDAIAAIHTRRTIRRFSSDPLSLDTLQALLEAGYDAPSGANKHPRQFVVVTEREALDRLATIHQYCTWLKSAPAAIAILGDAARSRYWLEDCCAAAENIGIAAAALGLGLTWAAMYQSDDAAETARREAAVREILGIPDALRVPMVLGMGMPATTPAERRRPPLASLVHWGTFGVQKVP